MDKEWDVLVVGAGPAGSAAAQTAAEGGVKTLLIDRKKELGTPVQCGEVVGESLIRQLKIKVPPQAIASVQDHTRFLLDRRVAINSREPYWKSVTLERKIFDKLLAAQAAEAGAKVFADTRLVSLETEDGNITEVELLHRGESVKVRPKVVIAADGVHSTVSKLMGVELFGEKVLAKGIEYEMVAHKKLPSAMQIFLEPEVGLGYGWIIPKGTHRANVGLGVIGMTGKRKDRLENWLSHNPIILEYFDLEQVLEVKTGDAPLPGFLGGPRRGNVLFAGDAAGQTLAFVGEGILPSYACGHGAGAVAASAVRTKEMDRLDCYQRAVEDLMGEELAKGGVLKDNILQAWTDQSIPEGDRTVLCGLLMSEGLFPEEMDRARELLSLPTTKLVSALKQAIGRRKMKATVSALGLR